MSERRFRKMLKVKGITVSTISRSPERRFRIFPIGVLLKKEGSEV